MKKHVLTLLTTGALMLNMASPALANYDPKMPEPGPGQVRILQDSEGKGMPDCSFDGKGNTAPSKYAPGESPFRCMTAPSDNVKTGKPDGDHDDKPQCDPLPGDARLSEGSTPNFNDTPNLDKFTVQEIVVKASDDRMYTGGTPNFDESKGEYIDVKHSDDRMYTGGTPNFDESKGEYTDDKHRDDRMYTGGTPLFDERKGEYRCADDVKAEEIAVDLTNEAEIEAFVADALKEKFDGTASELREKVLKQVTVRVVQRWTVQKAELLRMNAGTDGKVSDSAREAVDRLITKASDRVYGVVLQEINDHLESAIADKLKDGVKDELEKQNLENQKKHFEARRKVVERLEKAVKWMNEHAAANVESVIARMKGELKQSGAADSEAVAAIKAAIEGRQATGDAAVQELDVLADINAQAGNNGAAIDLLEQRLAKEHGSKVAYERLGKLYNQLGGRPLETFVNGKKPAFDVSPIVDDGRTLVPVRAIAEALGADVKWDDEKQIVTIVKGETTVNLPIGSRIVTVNGVAKTLDVPAKILAARTIVPVRFLSEALGLKVNWIPESQMIVVTEDELTDGTTDTAEVPAQLPATPPTDVNKPVTDQPAGN